jgi:uncharacterized integral membrane protein
MSVPEPRPSSERDPRARPDGEGRPLKLILIGLLALYAVLFVLLNVDDVNVNFVFFSARISLFVAIVLLLGIGFAAGYLTSEVRARRKRGAGQA